MPKNVSPIFCLKPETYTRELEPPPPTALTHPQAAANPETLSLNPETPNPKPCNPKPSSPQP